MSPKRACWVLLIVLFAGLAPAVWAESHEEAPASPPMFFIWTDHVSAANAAGYEAEVSQMMAKMAATEEGKKLQFFTLSGNGGYSYVIQLAEMGELMAKSKEMMAATMAAGGMEAWDASNKLVDHGSAQFIVLRPDLSYTPAEPREAEETGQFRHHDWWYVRPGHEQAIEKVAKEFVALYTEKKIDTGFRIYQAVTGDDLPLYIVTVTAANAADYHATDTRIQEILGEAGMKLGQEAVSHARRIEPTTAMMRPDLSMGM